MDRKVTPEQIADMRSKRARGVTVAALAKEYGIGTTTVKRHVGARGDAIVATADLVDRPLEGDPLLADLRKRAQEAPLPSPPRPLVPVSSSPEDVARAILEQQLGGLHERSARGEILDPLDQQRVADLPGKIRKMGGQLPDDPDDGPNLAQLSTPNELRLLLRYDLMRESIAARTSRPVLDDPSIAIIVELLACTPLACGASVPRPLDEQTIRAVLDVVKGHRQGPHGHWTSKEIDRPDAAEVEEFSVKTKDSRP